MNKYELVNYNRFKSLKSERQRKRSKEKKKNRNIKTAIYKSLKAKNKLRSNFKLKRPFIKRTISAGDVFSFEDDLVRLLNFISRIEVEVQQNRLLDKLFVDLQYINKIDISAICLFLSSINHLSLVSDTRFEGSFPENEGCKQYLENSGFLEYINSISAGRKLTQGKNLILKIGTDRTDNSKIGKCVEDAVAYITGINEPYNPVYGILMEICANSIEHANFENKNWQLAVHYNEDPRGKYVIFIMADHGVGILKTLKRKFGLYIKDTFALRDSVRILVSAFRKKYGSRTGAVNRNKGLPQVLKQFESGYISKLRVLTNDSYVDFECMESSRKLPVHFNGTFFYWVINKENIEKWKQS